MSVIDLTKVHEQLKLSGWSLDYVYLDQKKNRYTIESIEQP